MGRGGFRGRGVEAGAGGVETGRGVEAGAGVALNGPKILCVASEWNHEVEVCGGLALVAGPRNG